MTKLIAGLLVLGCATTALAQETELQKAVYGETALNDLFFADVFLDLGVTRSQAGEISDILAALQTTLAQIEQRRTVALQAAAKDLRQRRDALLAGETPAASSRLVQLERIFDDLDLDREAAYRLAYDQIVEELSEYQQRLLTEEAPAPAAGETAPTEEQMEAQRQRFRQQRLIYDRMVDLMETTRATVIPGDFAANAPTVVGAAVAAMTGLPPDNPLFQQLANYILQTLQNVYQMQPAQYRTQGPAIARTLAEATMYTIDQAAATPKDPAAAALQPVSPARLRNAIRYTRGAVVMRELAKRPEVAAEE